MRVLEKVFNFWAHRLFDSQLIDSVSTVNQLLLKQAVSSGKVPDNLSHPEVEWTMEAENKQRL